MTGWGAGSGESEERKALGRDAESDAVVTIRRCRPLSSRLSRVRSLTLSSKMGAEPDAVSFRKRFSVWSDVLMEQELTQSMQSQVRLRSLPGNVVKQERDVEDYLHDVPSGKLRPSRADKQVRPGSKKATRKDNKWKTKTDVVTKKEAAGKSPAGPSKSKKRKMKKKARKCSPSIDIALKLREPRIDLIQKVVETLGEVMAMRLLNQTLDVEAADGLMTCNGSRRRSPGGVFFHLVKSDKNVTPTQSRAIFGDEVFKRKKVTKKEKKSLNDISVGLDSFSVTGGGADSGPAAAPDALLQANTSSDNADK